MDPILESHTGQRHDPAASKAGYMTAPDYSRIGPKFRLHRKGRPYMTVWHGPFYIRDIALTGRVGQWFLRPLRHPRRARFAGNYLVVQSAYI